MEVYFHFQFSFAVEKTFEIPEHQHETHMLPINIIIVLDAIFEGNLIQHNFVNIPDEKPAAMKDANQSSSASIAKSNAKSTYFPVVSQPILFAAASSIIMLRHYCLLLLNQLPALHLLQLRRLNR